MSDETSARGGYWLPELSFALFAFLFHFVWEMWQVPFYEGMATAPHFEAVKSCTTASLGDALITIMAYWAGAAVGSRHWPLKRQAGPLMIYLFTGLLITIIVEWLSVELLGRWDYVPGMPQLPVLGTGLAPLLQWLILPPIVLVIVRRQIGASAES